MRDSPGPVCMERPRRSHLIPAAESPWAVGQPLRLPCQVRVEARYRLVIAANPRGIVLEELHGGYIVAINFIFGEVKFVDVISPTF